MFAMTGSLENGIENGCCNKTNKTADFRNGIAEFLTPLCSPRNKSREKLGIQAFGILKHYYRGKGCGRLGRNEKRCHVASDSE
jgi:hypothetical protein